MLIKSVADFWTRFGAALPSSATPVVAPNVGLLKSRASLSSQPVAGALTPVITPAAATWYWKSTICSTDTLGELAAPPSRHCSPTYETFSEVIVDPVLFLSLTAQYTVPVVPEPTEPIARSAAGFVPVTPKLYRAPVADDPVLEL